MRTRRNRTLAAAAAALLLASCQTVDPVLAQNPKLPRATPSQQALHSLPPPEQRVYVAVYAFADQTGQNKPNDSFPEYSRAVSQGGVSILINALKDAGRGSWFAVLERDNLTSLLQERQLIRANRSQFLGEDGKPLPPLRGLYNAGVLLSGGVIGYDSNVVTGGAGARYLGIGASTKYRRDQVTVYLRAASVVTGEVIVSAAASKTIYSVALNADTFRFVGADRILEVDAGVTRNEPREIALKQAIEKAVGELILSGAERGYWQFADKTAQASYLNARAQELSSLGYYPAALTAHPATPSPR